MGVPRKLPSVSWSVQTPPAQGPSTTVESPRTTSRSLAWCGGSAAPAAFAAAPSPRTAIAAAGTASAVRMLVEFMIFSFVGSSPSALGVVQKLVVVEALGLEDRASVGVEPVGARAVVVELDAVAIGIREVDRDGATVVGRVLDRPVVVEQPAHGAAELAPVGVEERDVIEAGVTGRRRRAAGALPGVQADVVVVVAGGEERGREAELAPVGRHAEPERVAVERERAVEVGDAQVHVADPDGGMDRFAVHAAQCPGRGRAPSVCSPIPAAAPARESSP